MPLLSAAQSTNGKPRISINGTNEPIEVDLALAILSLLQVTFFLTKLSKLTSHEIWNLFLSFIVVSNYSHGFLISLSPSFQCRSIYRFIFLTTNSYFFHKSRVISFKFIFQIRNTEIFPRTANVLLITRVQFRERCSIENYK